ncbi:hypothetical protein [Fusibacter bizertensis]
MKRIKPWWLVILILILIFGYYKFTTLHMHYNSNKISMVSMVTLPSPPKLKEITDPIDIQKIISEINGLSLKHHIFNGEKGWQMQLMFNGNVVVIMNNSIKVNRFWYSADKDLFTLFKGYYDDFDYIEHPYELSR